MYFERFTRSPAYTWTKRKEAALRRKVRLKEGRDLLPGEAERVAAKRATEVPDACPKCSAPFVAKTEDADSNLQLSTLRHLLVPGFLQPGLEDNFAPDLDADQASDEDVAYTLIECRHCGHVIGGADIVGATADTPEAVLHALKIIKEEN